MKFAKGAICFCCASLLFSWFAMLIASTSAFAAEVSRPFAPSSNQAKRQPNAVVQVSARLLSHLLTADIERTTAINDDVLGTSVRGTAYTRLHLSSQFLPDGNRGLLEMRFAGTSTSPRMVGHNGPATSISSSVSHVEVRKTVVFDQQGIHLQPSVATCRTCLSIDGIYAKRRIVQRIARRQANRDHSETQATTAEHTRLRVQAEVDSAAVEKLARANKQLQEMVQSPWVEQDSLPKLRRFSTTSSHLRIELGECGQSQIAMPESVPKLDERHDFVVVLHQSAARGIYEIVFGRQLANQREVQIAGGSAMPEKAPSVRLRVGTPTASIQLAALRPIELSYERGLAVVKLHSTSVELGKQKYHGKFTVFAKYRLEKTSHGPRLLRDGDLSVTGETHSGQPGDLVEASVLLRKLSSVLPPELGLEDLMPLSGSLLDRASRLEMAEIDLCEGWLVAGYRLPGMAMGDAKPAIRQ